MYMCLRHSRTRASYYIFCFALYMCRHYSMRLLQDESSRTAFQLPDLQQLPNTVIVASK